MAPLAIPRMQGLADLVEEFEQHPEIDGFRTYLETSSNLQGHSHRTGRLALALGLQEGYAHEELSIVYFGGMLHDIGRWDEAVCDEPRELTPAEWKRMKEHPDIGARLLEGFFLQPVITIARYHHTMQENGYPQGLPALDPEIARMVALVAAADKTDAVSGRPYQDETDTLRRIAEIRESISPFPECARIFETALTYVIFS